MPTEKIIVFSNCGTAEEAQRIARALVEARLAACVNILPGVQSVYRWQGAIEDQPEWTLLIKTTRTLFERLASELRRLHSYQVPEIVAIPILDGTADYLQWIEDEVNNTP